MSCCELQRQSLRPDRGHSVHDSWTAAGLLGTIASAATPAIARAQDAIIAALPRDLSPWGMYLNADPVVKGILIGLALASVITWTVCLAKAIEIFLANREIHAALGRLTSVRSATEGMERLANGEVRQFLEAALAEQTLSAGCPEADGVKERIASRLERIEAACGRRISRGTSVLATIGATAPFVGLFGTVWGIMNSFIGLAAAIPAVVIYNVFARTIAGYRAQLGDAAAEVLRLVGRDLDRSAAASVPAALSAAE
jgi:biopolymer transport protein ExbB